MSTITRDDRIALLQILKGMGSHGRAEQENREFFPKAFFPVPEHMRGLDPEVVLVVGPRGAGKTELFRAAIEFRLLPAISRHVRGFAWPPQEEGKSTWETGFPLQIQGFDAAGLQRYLLAGSSVHDSVLQLWFAYLLRTLSSHLDKDTRGALSEFLQLQGGAIQDIVKAFLKLGDVPLRALDRLEIELAKKDSFIFVGYDELDTMAGADWSAMAAGIKGLVAFWAAYSRRWRRIRAKIFLRTDLYDRYATVGGADLAKLSANRVDLSWSERSLYSMLLKRIANSSQTLLEYVKVSAPSIGWSEDPDIGHVPHLFTWEEARPVVERMVGPFMGANVKKGLVYRWLIDHVRDGRGRSLPRPFVRLVEEAARIEEDSPNPVRSPRILHPMSFRRALDRVSDEHFDHSRDEWPWLDWLRDCVFDEQVPWETRRELERLLKRQQPKASTKGTPKLPPVETDLIEYLVDVGILRMRSDGRIDVPDLFLHGLGLKRKGGVRRE